MNYCEENPHRPHGSLAKVCSRRAVLRLIDKNVEMPFVLEIQPAGRWEDR